MAYLLDWALNHYDAYRRLCWLQKKKINVEERRMILRVHFGGSTGDIYYQACEKAFRNVCARRKRIKARLDRMFKYPHQSFFLTFTFNNSRMDASYQSLRKYVQRWLNSNCDDYVCNVDYGKLHGRIHFHAVVYAPKKMDFRSYSKDYGFLSCKPIYSKDEKRLADYVLKFVNHASKVTTHFERIMMKRNKVWKETFFPDFLLDDDD